MGTVADVFLHCLFTFFLVHEKMNSTLKYPEIGFKIVMEFKHENEIYLLFDHSVHNLPH